VRVRGDNPEGAGSWDQGLARAPRRERPHPTTGWTADHPIGRLRQVIQDRLLPSALGRHFTAVRSGQALFSGMVTGSSRVLGCAAAYGPDAVALD
jgi:hypothetical protein